MHDIGAKLVEELPHGSASAAIPERACKDAGLTQEREVVARRMGDRARDEDPFLLCVPVIRRGEKGDLVPTAPKRLCEPEAVLVGAARLVGEVVDDDDSQGLAMGCAGRWRKPRARGVPRRRASQGTHDVGSA